MKYKILMAHTPIELAEIVNWHIRRKWWPLGGIAFGNAGTDDINYVQAMKTRGTADGAKRSRVRRNISLATH